jgi:hypothetical protein
MKVFVEFAADSPRSHRTAPVVRPSGRGCPLPSSLQSEPSRFNILCRAVFNALDRDSALRRSYIRQLWRGEASPLPGRNDPVPQTPRGKTAASGDDVL